MATLAEIYALTKSATLRHRTAAAIAAAAEDVKNESAATANHADRFTWAVGVLEITGGPETEAERLMWLVLQNTTIANAGEAATDNEIQFVINGLVNFAAGVDTST
jgi:hypothetical protein